MLSSLIDGIEARGEPVTTVLDDWHRIHDRAAIAIMAYLLDNACDELTFVVTSRTRSGLPLGRMRVQHELVEIDSTASRFDCDEARQFLVELRNLELDRRDVDRLCESTEGWVAALQRASLSLSSGPTAELIGRMSGRHHAIAEYLAENVLDTLDSDTRDFLFATSIAERICASLASELSGVKRGQAKLEDIEERDLFLLRIDEDGHWLRYHHLFADFARRRLERDHPEHVAGLDLAAARWFGDRDYVSEAVDHALSADDASRATELVEAGRQQAARAFANVHAARPHRETAGGIGPRQSATAAFRRLGQYAAATPRPGADRARTGARGRRTVGWRAAG